MARLRHSCGGHLARYGRALARSRESERGFLPACPGWASPAHKGFAGRKPRVRQEPSASAFPLLLLLCTLLEFSFFLRSLDRGVSLGAFFVRGTACLALMHGCMHCVRACMHACMRACLLALLTTLPSDGRTTVVVGRATTAA